MGTSFDKGNLLYGQRRWTMAADSFREELAINPHDSVSHAMLGLCHLQLKEFSAAANEVTEALRLGPKIAFVHYAAASLAFWSPGSLELRRGWDPLWFHLREGLSLDPRHVPCLSLQAIVHQTQKDWRKCLAAAEVGLSVDPNHESLCYCRAAALWSLWRRQEAIVYLTTVLASNPEQATIHRLRGWMLAQKKEFAPAFESLDQSLRLRPTDAHAQQLWHNSNLRRFRLSYAAGVAGLPLLILFYVLIFVVFSMFLPFTGSNSEKWLISSEIAFLCPMPLWIRWRFAALSRRRLDEVTLVIRLAIFSLATFWLGIAIFLMLDYLAAAQSSSCPASSRDALAVTIFAPAIPLFILDFWGTNWLIRLLSYILPRRS